MKRLFRHAMPSNSPADAPWADVLVGGVIALLFFIVFLGWAALAPLDAAAYAPGQITVSGSRQAVQHREGGTVRALHVTEGADVRRGEVLIVLDTSEMQAVQRSLTGQVFALLAQRARMTAERNDRRVVPMPPEFISLNSADAEVAKEAMRLQQLQLDARSSGRSSRIGIFGQRIDQVLQQIEGLNRQSKSIVEQRRLIEEELEGIKSLAARGYAPENRVRALQRSAAALDGDNGVLLAQIAQANEAIGESRLQMAAVQTERDEEIADQLRQVEVQLNDLRPRLAAVTDQISRSEIRAPASGKVVGLTLHTVGGVAPAAQSLMEIVPEHAALVISARVSPVDADNIHVGQETEVRFSAIQGRVLPTIYGRVTRISADSFIEEQSGRGYFTAEVRVPPEELARLGASSRTVGPGLPVEVIVPLRKRTALAYLVEPLAHAFWRAGREQ
ncbi:HlyD family type I secretion periplasmic adaptor subunit [Brevundimonas intermedia]|uniref:Membrane fusion protein (MFP) family protein n=1 Tax=Brevundimonas intermedia TaxID=74315 RepID=A0A4Y9S368_9CAUL|nr:HlyD family type I secretion periplasmic adaptor subunit [Brevundimonas intermedia]TFW14355.1 HlyD family type I secretion periplasmic adaptor subunit [Brevundimonas intermedia]